MRATFKTACMTSVATAIALPITPVFAQSNETAEDAGNVIVVTARKVEESVQDIPGSISAFSQEDLEARQIVQLEDVALQTPGLNFEDFSNGGFGSPTIRGTSQFSVTSLETNVALFIDGINIPRNYAFDIGATEFERIEVVKGPQSALYGANAFSGVINYITTNRSLTEIQASGKVSASENGGFDLFGEISVPLIDDTIALRLALGRSEFGGDFDNLHPLASSAPDPGTDESLGGYDKSSIQVGASFRPFDALTLDFDYYRFETESEQQATYRLTRNIDPALAVLGPSAVQDANCSNPNGEGFQLFCGTLPSTPPVSSLGVDGFVIDPRAFGLDTHSQLYRFGANLEITDDLDLSYLYGDYSGEVFSAGNSDRDPLVGTRLFFSQFFQFPFGVAQNAFTFSPVGDFDYKTHELRLAYDSPSGLYLMVGGYYQDGSDFNLFSGNFIPLGVDTTTAITSPQGNPTASALTETEKFAIFGRAALALADDRLNISVEGRYTDEEITLTNLISATGEVFVRPDDYFTGRASIDYSLTDDNLFYASVARGFKSGGINTPDGLVDEDRFFGSETNWTYEVGLKNVFLNGAATFNIAAFYIDWGDLQINRQPTVPVPFVSLISDNIGSASSKGIEIDGVWEFADGFAINGGLAYIDASFDEGTVSDRLLTSGSSSFGAIPVCDDIVCNANGDVGGNAIPRTSDWQWNIGISGEVPITDDIDVFGRADVAGQSSQFVSEINTAIIEARTLVSTTLGIRGENWSASIWARNLFDREYVANAFFIAQSFQLEYIPTLGNRRRVGATVSFDF